MELQVAGKKAENVKEFSLNRNQDGEIVLSDEKGWSIVSLRVVDEQIFLVKFTHIEDMDFGTDGNGRIIEVEE